MLEWLPQYLQFVTEGGVEGEVTGGFQYPLLTRALCWAAVLEGLVVLVQQTMHKSVLR